MPISERRAGIGGHFRKKICPLSDHVKHFLLRMDPSHFLFFFSELPKCHHVPPPAIILPSSFYEGAKNGIIVFYFWRFLNIAFLGVNPSTLPPKTTSIIRVSLPNMRKHATMAQHSVFAAGISHAALTCVRRRRPVFSRTQTAVSGEERFKFWTSGVPLPLAA